MVAFFHHLSADASFANGHGVAHVVMFVKISKPNVRMAGNGIRRPADANATAFGVACTARFLFPPQVAKSRKTIACIMARLMQNLADVKAAMLHGLVLVATFVP